MLKHNYHDYTELLLAFRGARLVGAANGLVCLSIYSYDNNAICLLNPSTRKFKKLPVAPTELLDCNKLEEYFLCGFGYDCVSDDYKAVLIGRRYFPKGIMAIVYNLTKNSWTPIPNVFSTENCKVYEHRRCWF